VAVNVNPNEAKEVNFGDPDICFLTIGGFVYFDNQKRVVGVNTIMPAENGKRSVRDSERE